MKRYYGFSALLGGLMIAGMLIATWSQAAQQAITAIPDGTTSRADLRTKVNTELLKAQANDTELYGKLTQDVTSAGNPVFNSLNSATGNVAAANAQVTKKWITGLSYTANLTSVIYGAKHYICTSSHTAGSTTEPGVGASWGTVWAESGSSVTATEFDGNLATTDDTLQEVAQKVDDLVLGGAASVSDVAYNESTWNGVVDVAPSKNAVRDALEALPNLTFLAENGLTAVGGVVTVNSPIIVTGTVELNTTTVAASGVINSGESQLLGTHATATNALTTDSCGWEFIGDPVAKTGFVPSVNGMLAVWCYVDANGYVQVRTSNNTAATITLNTAGNGATIKWMVRR